MAHSRPRSRLRAALRLTRRAMLKLRRGRVGMSKAHPLTARPLPLSAFAGRWPLRATLEPSRVAVFGEAVRLALHCWETDTAA